MDRVEEFERIADELSQLFADKNDDYGSSAFKTYQRWGMKSWAIRLEDKLRRIITLIKKQEDGEEIHIKDEALEDTLKDLASYSIMALIAMDEGERGMEERFKYIKEEELNDT